jgi:tight adherence protein C
MSNVWITFGLAGISAGVVAIVAAMRRPVIDPGAVLAELDQAGDLPLDEYSERLAQPLAPRILGPAGQRLIGMVRGLLPRNYLDRLRHKLVVAGLGDRLGPEEFVALQAISVGGGALLGLLVSTILGWGSTGATRALVIFAVLGFLAPTNRLQKSRQKRQGEVRRDLPDILDLLAISVEAGVGLEGAIDVVGSHFDTPLAREMGRLLREMELGVTRRNALQNLKRRVDVPEVSNFVLSLVQADALGMPIGRVLHTQAAEMRSKRRQWAREKAGKLPVKIVFPLVCFILPALFVVVLGPAVITISKNILHH